jgi:hypothetical protein
MKKPTKSKPKRHPRRPRSQRKPKRALKGLVDELREQVREALLTEIRGAVAATAQQMVADEVEQLVGLPWSRKGSSPLRRGGYAATTVYLDGEPHLLTRPRVRDQDAGTEHPVLSRNWADFQVSRSPRLAAVLRANPRPKPAHIGAKMSEWTSPPPARPAPHSTPPP